MRLGGRARHAVTATKMNRPSLPQPRRHALVWLGDCVCEGVLVLDLVTMRVRDDEKLRDAVRDAVRVRVSEGVCDGDGVPVLVGVRDGVGVRVCEGVRGPLRVCVCERVCDGEREGVCEDVCVPVCEGVRVLDGDGEGVRDRDGVRDSVVDAVRVLDGAGDRVCDRDGVGDRVLDAVRESEPDFVIVGVGVTLGVRVLEKLGLAAQMHCFSAAS